MPTDCQHLHTALETTGSVRFVDGDIEDTTREIVVCTDCGETVAGEPLTVSVELEFTF